MMGLIAVYLIIGFVWSLCAMDVTFHGATFIAWVTCWPYMMILLYKKHEKKLHKDIKKWWATKPWKVRI